MSKSQNIEALQGIIGITHEEIW